MKGKFYLYHKTRMMSDLVQSFNEYRTRTNELILSQQNLVINRLFNLDTHTYQDCIKYHLGKCHDCGISTEEIYEVFAVANIVGGTIVIPHTRRAAEYWEALKAS
jgi:alkylhydroperoxidase/carboxymuconolactone decarboxylase family protein YurZ